VVDGEVSFHVMEESDGGGVVSEEDHLPPQVGTGTKGATFGELALLYNTPRAASVRAMTLLQLYRIDQMTFRSLLMTQQKQARSGLLDTVKKIFPDVDETMQRRLVDAFSIVTYRPGERIINKGDKGDVLYIVKSGQVRVSTDTSTLLMKDGEYFGEQALLTGQARAANVTADTQSTLMCVSKVMLETFLGPLDEAFKLSFITKLLRSTSIFQCLRLDEVDKCVGYLKEEHYKKGDKIVPYGKFYGIKEGRALMMSSAVGSMRSINNGPILQKLEKFDYFEDLLEKYPMDIGNTLSSPSISKLDDNTIYVEEDLVCFTLLASDLSCVVGNLKDFFARCPADASHSVVTRSNAINLSKLKLHRILGVGSFGKVWLVTVASNGRNERPPCALKIVSKRLVIKQRMVESIMREKNVMESCMHPFLMSMVSSFQDENYLYFVLELNLGGELFDIIYPKDEEGTKLDNKYWKASKYYKSFGQEDDTALQSRYGVRGIGVRNAIFYSSCIIDGLAYLHHRRIAYRDMKPENILMNANGYCVIIDMGFAKIVLDKTYTMCGTPEYIAPEIILNSGHDHVSDYWSFACLLYELVVGQTPFVTAGIDQMSLLKRITKSQYAFPSKMSSLRSSGGSGLDNALFHWKDLISRLLKPNPVERLGNLQHGVDDIMNHRVFASIDFNEFRNQKNPAPWVPNVDNRLDKSHAHDRTEVEKPEVFITKISDKDQAAFAGF
jgi:serine/threonine protein kinase/CRP-like cAMP-binding protein